MDLGLKDRVAIVSASSKGLGRAVAEELSAEGAAVVLCARGADALEETRKTIADRGGRVAAIAADVSKAADVNRVIDFAMREFNRVDILVNNSGGPPAGPFEVHSPETWRNTFDTLLESVLNLSRAVLPGMKERRWGRIVNITSITVKQPVEGLILSNSLRAAVTGFARTLANEVAEYGVTVNNVLPGYTRTQRLVELAESTAQRAGIDPERAYDRWISEIPMRRLGEPREFAAAVAFLASERASFITGVSLPVDGGWIKSLH